MMSQTDWNPEKYLHFEAQRTQPAQDLLARIAHHRAQWMTDLGCGPANSTALLRQNWPRAHIIGVDYSANMIEQARQRLPSCQFVQRNFSDWQPEIPQDIIFANASLHWADNHEILLPKLFGYLVNKGILAIQMPDNLQEPSHTLMEQLAQSDSWRVKIRQPEKRPPMPAVAQYHDIFAPIAAQLAIWRTTYFHALPDVASIADWFGSTALRPYLDGLGEADKVLFKQQYIELLEQSYFTRADGSVLLALPRLFIVAHKG